MGPWIGAPATALLLAVGLYCHCRWRGLFAEDPPQPTGRRQHAAPTPMAGQVPALVSIVALAVTTASPWLVGGVLLATLTGFFDDRGKAEGAEMAWYVKGIALCIAVGCVLVHLGGAHSATTQEWVLYFAWLFLLTNAVNFMDNTDGVAASVGGMGLLLATGGDGPMAFAAWAFLGFLPFNWPRPAVFLGDAGSLSLGLCLATAGLESGLRAAPATGIHWGWAALPIAVFAVDFVQVVTARLILGVPPWVGDRRHLTHVCMNLGLPRVLVAPLFVALAYVPFTVLAG